MNRYVFDLDNTLIYTDSLNNDSYNHALNRCGLAPINTCKRITRDIVFKKYPHLNNYQKNEIVELKQEYFAVNLQKAIPNTSILRVLEYQKKQFCILWTSADETRVKALLEYYNLYNAFRNIIFSSKINVSQDIEKISQLFECNLEQLVFYEDNLAVIKKLQKLKLNVISV